MTLKTTLRLSTLWVFLLLLSADLLIAQTISIEEEVAPLSTISNLVLPNQDNEKLRVQYKFYEESKTREPSVFAEAISTDLNCSDHGSWESSKEGYLLWRQRITSEDAYSLNLGFSDFYLPSSASLFIYDQNRTVVIGPITQKDNEEHKQWWSPVIPSDEVIIELQIAPQDINEVGLTIGQVNHDFSGFGAVLSGSCNVDVVCGASDGLAIIEKYRNVINSVGQMTINGQFDCTGSLLNNTRNDCTPYLITAEHCGITMSNASSVVVYWNYQNSQCRTPGSIDSGNQGDGRRTEFNSGSSFIAKYDQTDFAMVLLDDPVDPNSNPYYLGWDRETETVDSLAVVHHPRGEEKRISFDYDTPEFNFDRNFIRIFNWEVGTTESGSSGSPLVTTEGLVVGLLSGGDAACGNRLEDDFGMIKNSWEGGGTPETSLKSWLDPINTGQTKISGRFCSDLAVLNENTVSICTVDNPQSSLQLTATTGFESGGTLRVENAPQGLEINFSKNEIFQGETIDINFEASESIQSATYELTLIVENDLGPTEYFITVLVFAGDPNAPILNTPQDGAEDLNFEVALSWSDESPQYRVEVSRTPNFTTVERVINNLADASFILGNLESTTTYFWRVRGINECGSGVFSSVRSFTTGTIVCETFEAIDLPINIGTEPVTITSTINVETTGSIADVNINGLRLTHSWITDLTISLISPAGTEVFLIETPCSGENNINASFDDQSDIVNLDCPLTLGNTYKPLESLSAFENEDATGLWTLKVEDAISEDGGSLDQWTLELCLNKTTNNKNLTSDPTFVEICDKAPEAIDLVLQLSGIWTSPSAAIVTTGSGLSVGSSTSPDPIGSASEVVVSIDNPSVLVGQDELTVSITDGDEVISKNIQIVHTVDVSTPELISPVEGEEKVELNPELDWTESLSTDGSYTVTLSRNMDLSDPIGTFSSPSNNLIIANDLAVLTTYYWQVTALGTCSDLSSGIGSFTTDNIVATVDESLESVQIYPSPVDQVIFVDLKDINLSQVTSYQLLSLSGQLIQKRALTNQLTEIQASALSQGIYLISLIGPEGIHTRKIVVSR